MKNGVRIKSLLLTIALATVATVSFGQAPKNDRRALQNPASNKQRTAEAMRTLSAKHEQRREKPRSLFLPRHAGTNDYSSLRAVQASKLLLDSTVVRYNPTLGEEAAEDQNKTVYQYNAAGNMILETIYDWNVATGQWREWENTGYDDRGNTVLSSSKYYYYYYEDLPMEGGHKDEYAYDHLNWKTLETRYDWEDGQWVALNKNVTVYTDNAGSYTEERTTFQWGTGAWRIADKYEATFAGQRQMRSPDSADEYWSGDDFPSLPNAGDYTEKLLTEAWWSDYEGAGNWDNGYKTEYTYDAQGLLTAMIDYWWDSENNAWATQPDSYSSYTVAYIMDGNNNVLSYTKAPVNGYSWDPEKTEYTYDAQNRAITAVSCSYDPYEQQWVNYTGYERAFDGYGNVILNISKSGWDNGSWQYQFKREYAYDASGRQTSYIQTYEYDEYDEYGYKEEYTFDSNGNELSIIRYVYDTATQTFVPLYKGESTYGDVLIYLGGGDYEYNPLTSKESRWENGDWVVEMEYKYEWTFDAANNPLSVEMWEKDGDDWTWYVAMTFYYSQHVITGIQTVSSNRLQVWISGGELKIENAESGANVQLFDISGKLMVSGILSNDKSIRISSLPAGVYFLKAGNQTVKFIKH
jgi:hypothetical protein